MGLSNNEFTEDAILGGRVILRQPKRGYRINLDTVLLAASMRYADNGRVIELCCGVGAALIAVAKASPHLRCVGVERDPAYAALARENVSRNSVGDNVEIIEADALAPHGLGVFDAVFFNPPYDDPADNRAPAEERRAAHVEERPLEDWIKLWSNRMASGASLTLIHRAPRLPEILAALSGRLGGAEILPIRPNSSAPASRVLVRAWKGSRAPLTLHKGLDLHPSDAAEGKYTSETEAILRGEAGVWPG